MHTNKTPLVSIILIFLNEESFIRDAIESVLSQQYPDWELILVDDGSTDNSTSIARQYADGHHPRIRYVTHDGGCNRGMSASRNLGASTARGSLIAFLDADDVWMADKLERQASLLQAHPEAACVYGPALIWHGCYREAVDIPEDTVQDLRRLTGQLVLPPKLLALHLQDLGTTFCPSGLTVRRNVFESVGGFEAAFDGLFEDQVFSAKITSQYPVYLDDRCLFKYRQHGNSCCAGAYRDGTVEHLSILYLTWLKGYLANQGLRLTRIEKIVSHRLEQLLHSQETEALKTTESM